MAENRFRFTQQRLEALTTDKEREWFFDDMVQPLAILVTQGGGKSYYLFKFHGGKTHRIRLAKVGDIPIPKARQLALDKLGELVTGKHQAAKERARHELSLSTIFEEYFEFVATHRRQITNDISRRQWKKCLEPWAGKRTLPEIRRRDVRLLHGKLGTENGHHLANRVVALLRAAINRAIREHELDIPNPAASITFYRELSRTRRLHNAELPAFFQAVAEEPNENIRDFVLLSLFTGARKANLLAMRWAHLSLEEGLWTVPASEAKSGVEMTIVLADAALQVLGRRLPQATGPYVFPGLRGAPHMMDPKMGWKRILERAGLHDLHMHDLRRSLASFQIDTGAPLEVIQKTLGHGNKATTEIYARMAMDPVRASVERAIEAMVGGRKTT